MTKTIIPPSFFSSHHFPLRYWDAFLLTQIAFLLFLFRYVAFPPGANLVLHHEYLDRHCELSWTGDFFSRDFGNDFTTDSDGGRTDGHLPDHGPDGGQTDRTDHGDARVCALLDYAPMFLGISLTIGMTFYALE